MMTRLHYFERGTRYYRITLTQDLFGCWVVKREWGSIPRHSLRSLTMVAADEGAAIAILEAAIMRRRKRGYVERGNTEGG